MRIFPKFLLLTALVVAPAFAQSQSPEAMIRAGHNIAVTSCVACHVVSPGQTIKPALGSAMPSFESIANRPDTTREGLEAAMKTARWHDPSTTPRLLPMSRISDRERTQVAAYILSLRKPAQ